MASRLSLIIVTDTMVLEFGFLAEVFKDVIILLAVITGRLCPFLFKALLKSEASLNDSGVIERRKLSAGWMWQWE